MCQQAERESKDSLCWDCKNATGKCSWSRRFKPVPGWEAVPTKIKQNEFASIDSFNVIKCPLFENDGIETMKEKAKRLGISRSALLEKLKILRGINDVDLL